MITMNNSLIIPLQCQQRTQNDTTHALKVIHQSQLDHVKGSLIDDILAFEGNLKYSLIGF